MFYACCAAVGNIPDVAGAGYDGIELSGRLVAQMPEAEVSEIARIIAQKGLSCRGFNDYSGAGFSIVGPGFSADASREYAKKVFSRAAVLGVRTVGIGAPMGRRLPEGYEKSRADGEAAEFLRITADIARPYGITVLWEALNDKICNYGFDHYEAARFVRTLNTDNVAMVMDIFHMYVMGVPASYLDEQKALMRHVHISRLADLHRGFLTDGEIPKYKQYLDVLVGTGYDEALSIEPVEGSVAESGARSLEIMKELTARG